MAPRYNKDSKASELVQEFADNIKGKVILVTGTSPGGLGALYCTAIAKASPSLIILTGRTAAAIQKTADEIKAVNSDVKTQLLIFDLASFQSVRKAAGEVNSWKDVPHIDLLVNNAGIMAVPYGTTEDGFERQFGTNHLGHFLFTNLIMDKILASKTPRIVVVSSVAHRTNPIRWADYNWSDGKTYQRWMAYGQSKTANILMAISLAQKLQRKGLQAFSLHPGIFLTNLSRDLDFNAPDGGMSDLTAAETFMGTKYMHPENAYLVDSEEQVIATHVFCSFSDDIQGHNGKYFHECHVADEANEEVYSWATSAIYADKLWTLSEKLVGQEFKY